MRSTWTDGAKQLFRIQVLYSPLIGLLSMFATAVSITLTLVSWQKRLLIEMELQPTGDRGFLMGLQRC